MISDIEIAAACKLKKIDEIAFDIGIDKKIFRIIW